MRYMRKCDLNNHLKIHAYAPSAQDGLDDDLIDDDSLMTEEEETVTGSNKGRRKKMQSAPRKRKINTATGMSKRSATEHDNVKMEMGKYVSIIID